jgi:hypothetical protein
VRGGDAAGALAAHEALWDTFEKNFGDHHPGAASQLTAVAAAAAEAAAALRLRLRSTTLDGDEEAAGEVTRRLEELEAAAVELLRRCGPVAHLRLPLSPPSFSRCGFSRCSPPLSASSLEGRWRCASACMATPTRR